MFLAASFMSWTLPDCGGKRTNFVVMEKIFYVYVDHTMDANRPFYVGKGQLDRVRLKERGQHWKAIVNKHGWCRETCRTIVLGTKDEQFAFDEEVRLIAEFGTHQDGSSARWGANKTRGGEGSSGYKWSDRSRENVSGPNHRMSGKKMSDQERAKRAGENNGDARLTWSIIDEIRKRHINDKLSTRVLGRLYGVTSQHIQKILTFQKWKPELRPTIPADRRT